jgi:co-chaperonin GroES (HSP10)
MLTALGNNVVIQLLEEENKTASGLYVAKSPVEFRKGIVLSIGNGEEVAKLALKEKDTVLVAQFFDTGITVDKSKIAIVYCDNVAARVNKE